MSDIQDQTEVSKAIIRSLLRDFFAGLAMAGMQASLSDGSVFPSDAIANAAYGQADCMMQLTETPGLIAKLKNL